MDTITIPVALLQTMLNATAEAEALRQRDAEEAFDKAQAKIDREAARDYAKAQRQALKLLKKLG